jgi:ribosomal protein L22
MTPENPQDPQKGKVDEAKVEAEAAEAKETAAEAEAQPEPKAKPKAKAKPAKPAAADETGVDKAAATAAAADDEPEATEAAEEPAAEEPAAKPKSKAKAKAKAEPAKKSAPKRRRERPEPEPGVQVRAHAKYVRTSARKARLVCDHIRGKDVEEARAILAFTPRAAAKAWIKLLESAVANAEHNHELIGEDLRIAAVHADEGPTLKRYRPRAMGRATRIRKRTSHLTITLTPKES